MSEYKVGDRVIQAGGRRGVVDRVDVDSSDQWYHIAWDDAPGPSWPANYTLTRVDWEVSDKVRVRTDTRSDFSGLHGVVSSVSPGTTYAIEVEVEDGRRLPFAQHELRHSRLQPGDRVEVLSTATTRAWEGDEDVALIGKRGVVSEWIEGSHYQWPVRVQMGSRPEPILFAEDELRLLEEGLGGEDDSDDDEVEGFYGCDCTEACDDMYSNPLFSERREMPAWWDYAALAADAIEAAERKLSEQERPKGERVGDCIVFPILHDTEPMPRSNYADPFDEVLAEVSVINRKKRADYATDENPWSNFKAGGDQVGQPAGVAVEVLIAIKQARLRELLFSGRVVNNESVRDTLLDRATYSLIALAMFDEGLYEEDAE